MERLLVPVGNTFRLEGACASVVLVLVVGETITSHWWLNLLPLCDSELVRFFITEADLRAVAATGRLHVRPTHAPAFLVLRNGFVVDWLPAPLPEPGAPANPKALLASVEARVRTYHDPTR